MTLDAFYPVVPSALWVARVVEAGARLVQLRLKDAPEAEVLRQTVEARTACARAGATLVLNDFWRVALSEAIDFVHLGQGDLDDADVPALRRRGVRIGVSTHDHAELERALTLDPDYVALGPVYPTTLKVMPWSPQGLDRIGEWKRRIGGRPLVAIGGITLPRVAGVLQAGADCVAVVSDIVAAEHPDSRTRAWVTATRPAVGTIGGATR